MNPREEIIAIIGGMLLVFGVVGNILLPLQMPLIGVTVFLGGLVATHWLIMRGRARMAMVAVTITVLGGFLIISFDPNIANPFLDLIPDFAGLTFGT